MLHGRAITLETRRKISESRKANITEQSRLLSSISAGKHTKGKFKKPTSLLELSSRTISKIVKRLKMGCSYCGWNETICDIHHINGRKIPDCDNHTNLTYICPNCHRKCHKGLIKKEDLTNLQVQIGDKWKEFYYG